MNSGVKAEVITSLTANFRNRAAHIDELGKEDYLVVGNWSYVIEVSGISIKCDRVHMVFGEGDFALAMSKGKLADSPTAFYDLFRVEAHRIAEHWETLETIPEREDWKNINGKF